METQTMTRTHTLIPSPIGTLTAVREDGALAGLYMRLSRRPLDAELTGPRADAGFDDVAGQLGEYFAGERTAFDLALRPAGTAFDRSVRDLLLGIPYGETRSYGDLARALGDRSLAQAVGAANGRNPLAVVVPCHRVIGADGTLTGYAGGLHRKRFLLDLEQRGERLF
jgi:methylated-DNA-[protein]-cysteine S-methyltransferase